MDAITLHGNGDSSDGPGIFCGFISELHQSYSLLFLNELSEVIIELSEVSF